MQSSNQPCFIDLFAGCGGLSLGLMQAGFRGLFAVEKDDFAFETLQHNLGSGERNLGYNWPDWLPKEAACLGDVNEKYQQKLGSLSGSVDLIVGGPPCQGFSSAGKRNPADPRNQLVSQYLRFIETLQPRAVLIENVRGMSSDFKDSTEPSGTRNYANWIVERLSEDYDVSHELIDVSRFGVPQRRMRLFIVGIRRDVSSGVVNPLVALEKSRQAFLSEKGIPGVPVTSREAISDLEVSRNGTVPSQESKGFQEISYIQPKTTFQRLMREGVGERLTDTRLARHQDHIVERFSKIIERCHAEGRLNVSLSSEYRASLGLKKSAIRVLDPDSPSPTITSMPDDLIHYSEPRTLTVRENARLQSFPDWFEFRGKYTSGGLRRRSEVPRFTQVANAVPPIMAEALGRTLISLLQEADLMKEVKAPTVSLGIQAA
ncbi:DNA cytosine methyltransferase [Leisingera sp. SS27]|uniref:DNA cytosine methyltransferase n=1 Tax=Leisingera sp. SS27 TaxID=2979462 RepID=UPI00233134E3|nr:DNA cytosine methyltransferase [Leisingera sp. SS27]MDC0657413.1 DNA cytosine methyltransferase [Leisingera sp. SS27]